MPEICSIRDYTLYINVGFSKVEEIIPSFEVRKASDNKFNLFVGNKVGGRSEKILSDITGDKVILQLTTSVFNTINTFNRVFDAIHCLDTEEKTLIKNAINLHIGFMTTGQHKRINLL